MSLHACAGVRRRAQGRECLHTTTYPTSEELMLCAARVHALCPHLESARLCMPITLEAIYNIVVRAFACFAGSCGLLCSLVLPYCTLPPHTHCTPLLAPRTLTSPTARPTYASRPSNTAPPPTRLPPPCTATCTPDRRTRSWTDPPVPP